MSGKRATSSRLEKADPDKYGALRKTAGYYGMGRKANLAKMKKADPRA